MNVRYRAFSMFRSQTGEIRTASREFTLPAARVVNLGVVYTKTKVTKITQLTNIRELCSHFNNRKPYYTLEKTNNLIKSLVVTGKAGFSTTSKQDYNRTANIVAYP